MCLPVHPYRIEVEFEHAGLKYAVTQAREAEHRCGYVRVPPTHPLHGKHAEDLPAEISISHNVNFCRPEPCEHEDGAGWWLGFDCAGWNCGLFDPTAKLEEMVSEEARFLWERARINPLVWLHGHYWTQAEVEAEVRLLAEQLAEVK